MKYVKIINKINKINAGIYIIPNISINEYLIGCITPFQRPILLSIPKMIIMKRTDGGTDAWQVYHQSLGNTKRLTLQTTAAADADINYFNNKK